MIRGQPNQEAGPVPKKLAVPYQLFKLIVQVQEYSKGKWQEKGIFLTKRRRISGLISADNSKVAEKGQSFLTKRRRNSRLISANHSKVAEKG